MTQADWVKEFSIRCYNVEEGYGFCVMVDQLVEMGMTEFEARDFAKQWINRPFMDKGNL